MKNLIKIFSGLVLCLGISTQALAQNIGINTTGAVPDSSAALDISSSTQGLLIPRMDSTARKNISNPAKGLMVYDSTYNQFYFYNGTLWSAFTGDTGNDNLGNHIARQNLQLNNNWLNNDGGANEGITINNDGQLGVGTSPSATFHVSMGAGKSGFRVTDTLIHINDYGLPVSDGTSAQILSTDGAGNVSWSNTSGTDAQDLSLSGNTLSLTNDATTVDLSSYIDNVDAQDLSISGNTLSLTNDATTVDLSSYLDNTDAQDLSLSGSTLSLSNDATTVDLSSYLDNTDAQDLSISGNTLSLSNDATAVDLNSYLDNTDAQDLSLSGGILSLTNDGTTVDLNPITTADDLGNHIATQQLQLNDNWLNNDGGTEEGINIDSIGRVGIDTIPVSTFHVNMKGSTMANPINISYSTGSNVYVYTFWQSFTAPEPGKLVSITSYLTNTGGSTIYAVREFGSVVDLYSGAINCVNGDNTFTFPNVPLEKGKVYTFNLFFQSRGHSCWTNSSNPYPGGNSSNSITHDMDFSLNMLYDHRGFQVDSTGVTINRYTLPIHDGAPNQVLTSDGNGNVNWTTPAASGGSPDGMGNHTAIQNVQLNGNWLSNDGGNEGILIDNDGKVGIGRGVGSVGSAKLEYYGANASTAGPHIQVVNSGDDYPLFQQLNWGHDNIALGFDAYFDGQWRSSSSTSNFVLYKFGATLTNFYSNGNAQGTDFTLSTGTVLTAAGRFGIGIDPVTNLLEVDGNASKTTAGNWLANSDARLKKNITPLSSQEMLNKLLALQGVTYEWDDNKTGTQRPEGIQYGFTAQNIQEVFPSLVTADNQGYLQTPYGTYDAMTVEAIRALNEKIEQLEEGTAKLQSKAQSLESKSQKLDTHSTAMTELKAFYAELELMVDEKISNANSSLESEK